MSDTMKKKMILALASVATVLFFVALLAGSSFGQDRSSAASGEKSSFGSAVTIKQAHRSLPEVKAPSERHGRMGRATWWDPDPSHSIQDAIDNASNGDIIYVGPGTYFENIDFKGKALLVQSTGNYSNTFIEPATGWPVVTFENSEGLDSVLWGFTIRNGTASGIRCADSSPTISHCSIEQNSNFTGGGIYCYNSSALIEDNVVELNAATGTGGDGGGAIYCYNGSPIIRDNFFQYNTSGSARGGAITIAGLGDGSALIENNQILDNAGTGYGGAGGGAIYCSTNTSATIKNNTITGNSTLYDGGGVYIDFHTNVTLSGNTISGNSAENGGGIYYANSPSITDNTITDNTATSDGGGIYCSDHINHGSATISSNTIEYNSAGYYGGGVYCKFADPIIEDNVIGYNSTNMDGGGIWISNASADFEIKNNLIRFNTAKGMSGGIHVAGSLDALIGRNMIIYNEANGSGSCGGGISCVDSAFPKLNKNTIKGNSAESYGGGIFCDSSAYPAVTYNSITGNQAAAGGGISCHDFAKPAVATNWIFDNQAAGNGGGIYCGVDSEAVFTNNTLFSNDADNGGGVCCEEGRPQFFNMIFWQNTALSSGREIYIDGGDLEVSYSDVEGGIVGGVVVVSGSIFWGQGMIDEDPRFKRFTWPIMANYHIESLSPCADAGSDTAPNLTEKDIDGDKRILDDCVDMGVDETDWLEDGLGGPSRETYGNKKPTVYKRDSGKTDNLLCWTSGGDMVGMHCFDTLPGGEILVEVGTIFGSVLYENFAPGNGTPTDFYVWEATSFGDPSNAVLLTQGNGVVGNVDTDVHWWDPCPCTVTTPHFWVAYNLHHAPYEFCLSIDSTNPYVYGAAFFTGTNTLYGFDPLNLYGNQYPPVESSYGFWTVRATY